MSLESPLLPSYSDKMEMTSEVERSHHRAADLRSEFKQQNSTSYTRQQIYALHQPKILLETITARTTVLMLFITYFFFFVCWAIDFQTLQLGFSNNANFVLGSMPCQNQLVTPLPASSTSGCLTHDNTTWSGTVLKVSNVISVQLSIRRDNITAPLIDAISTKNSTVFMINYELNLWACYYSDGCGENFPSGISRLASKEWKQVLTLPSQEMYIDTSTALTDGYVTAPLMNITFQNQESVPTNGIVKSYFVSVQYLDLPPPGIVFVSPLVTPDLYYDFQIVNRPSPFVSTIATITLLVLTILLTSAYTTIVYRYQTQWLPEQVWLVVYFVALIMFQNPIYSAITLNTEESAAPGAAYASYFLDGLAQSAFLVIWLCFADSVNNRHGAKLCFYVWKLLFGLTFFVVSIVILTYQFPDLSSESFLTSERSPVQAVANWPEDVKITFCVFSLLFLVLFWVWAVWWFITLYRARTRLSKLPYMNTRYLQLSYRFFALQATLVTLYYVTQYGFVIYNISPGSYRGNPDLLTALTNNINTLFRQQTQLFGKVLFLTTYAFSLGFLLLPASFLETKLASTLRSTYVVSEEEREEIVLKRRSTIRALNRVMLINNLVIKAKAEVFCVDRALHLRNVAYETYGDPKEMDTEGLGMMSLEQHGYELVPDGCKFNKEKATFVLIARHKVTRKLVISFRGTHNTRHWKTNMQYGKKDVDILALAMPSLDAADQLGVEESAVDFEKQSYGFAGRMLNTVDEEDEDEERDWGYSRQSSLSVFGGNSSINAAANDRVAGSPVSRLKRTNTMRDTIFDGISKGGQSIKGMVGLVSGATASLIDQSAGLVRSAAKHTPVLQGLVKPFVHSGFWDAYAIIREEVHAVVRRELKAEPADIFVTGHSLGGALATIASLDIAVHTIPRINAFFAKKWRLQESVGNEGSGWHSHKSSDANRDRSDAASSNKPCKTRRIRISMYNYGSPKVGNGSFTYLVNKWVPDSFRIVVDGDIVSALPPTGYRHAGTEVVVDSRDSGSIIIDRSFVERWLRPSKTRVKVHSLKYYESGLINVKNAYQRVEAGMIGSFSGVSCNGSGGAVSLHSLSAAADSIPPLSLDATCDGSDRSSHFGSAREGSESGLCRSKDAAYSPASSAPSSPRPDDTWRSTCSTPNGAGTEAGADGLSSKLDGDSFKPTTLSARTTSNPLLHHSAERDRDDLYSDAVSEESLGDDNEGQVEHPAETDVDGDDIPSHKGGIRGFIFKQLQWFGILQRIDLQVVSDAMRKENPFPTDRS